MVLKRYEIIEHTADVGLRVWGKNLRQVFVHAAQGMFSIIAKKKSAAQEPKTTEFNIKIHANNQEELLLSWLSELVTLSDIHNLIFIRFQIHKLTKTDIQATVAAEQISKCRYKIQTPIKAVSYHQLKIVRQKQQFIAEVIFDA